MLPLLKVGFSRSGEFSLGAIDLLRLLKLAATSQTNRTATIPAYKNCLAFVAIKVVNQSTGLFAVQKRDPDVIVARGLHWKVRSCSADTWMDQRNLLPCRRRWVISFSEIEKD